MRQSNAAAECAHRDPRLPTPGGGTAVTVVAQPCFLCTRPGLNKHFGSERFTQGWQGGFLLKSNER